MSLGKVARKLKRVGKTALQFRFTSTFEYIDLQCSGTWRPDALRVTWLRNHRKVQSIPVPWIPSVDRGPQGAEGKCTFDPPLAVSLIVTLYQESSDAHTIYDEKIYKYYIENVGPNGKKVIASFNCDMSDYAGIPNTRNPLDMNFKPISQKVSGATLGITLECDFIKKGSAVDDDMQSTYSHASVGRDSITFDDEEEEEEVAVEGGGKKLSPLLSVVQEEGASLRMAVASGGRSPNVGARRSASSKDIAEDPSDTSHDRDPASSHEEASALEQEGEVGEGGQVEASLEPPSPTSVWLGEAALVDCFGKPTLRQKLDNAEIIGLYFSANWCPPCRRFLPKLIKFYHHLKQHNKSFEILYISSDYSKQEMLKYMQDQQMPWVGLAFDSITADRLRTDFGVSAIPLFTIITTRGTRIEDSVKKMVEGTSNSSQVLKLYNSWYEKMGLPALTPATKPSKKTLSAMKSSSKDEQVLTNSVRTVVDEHAFHKRPSHSKSVTRELLDEKEERIRYLEEVNMTLKHTNDELTEEVAELKKQLDEATQELSVLEQSSRKMQTEKEELLANINLRGWLFKRGVKGPTANLWRRRYFRCDQGGKLYYYRSPTQTAPQGYIDLDRVITVQVVTGAQQDKNHATFLVQCDGRTFQLQAHDEPTMRKWISAIEYLSNWRKRNTSFSREGATS